MQIHEADLSTFARNRPEPANDSGAPARVPLPHFPWRTRVVLPAAILGVSGAILLYAARDALLPAVDVRVVPAVVLTGVQAQATTTVQAPGWVEADPYPVGVSALTEGIVREVLVLEGQPVEPGQVIARLVDDDARLALARAEAELAERQARLAAAQAAADAAQQHWDNPIELTRQAAAAEAAWAEKQAELARWPHELAAEQARERELAAEHERIARLHQDARSSEIEMIRAREQHRMQQARVESTLARKAILEAQAAQMQAARIAAREHLRLRIAERQALEQARAELEQARAARKRAQAAVDEARLRLERMEVRSPSAGVVMARLVEPGSKLMLATDDPRSAQVARLYDPARLQVRVDVPLASAAGVGVDQRAEIVVDVLPQRTFRGRVTRVVHEADVQRNTLQVKVAIEDPAPELKPEMLARVRLLSTAPAGREADQPRLFVPESLLRYDASGQAQVWLIDQARRVAELRRVSVGAARVGRWVEVAEGLLPGDRLAAEGIERLRPGRRVRIVGEVATELEPHPGGS